MIDYNDQSLHRIDPAYLEHYGLNEAPFSAMVDDRFYFNTNEAHQRMNMMVHMTQYSDMVLMVLGDEGMGKTTTLQSYVKSAHDNWHICRINANTMMDRDQLLFRIAEDFGLESLPANSAELQELLYDKMTQLHQNDVLPVIIIDDAHELSVDAISQLFIMAEIKAGDTTMVHVVLFADPLIEKTISASTARKIRERIGHAFELNPLNEDDTEDYILTRLTVAGLRTDSPFSAKVIKQIHKQSRGVPARINELAHIALDDAEGGAEPEYDDLEDDQFAIEKKPGFITPMRFFAVLSLSSIVSVGLWQQDRINQLFHPAPSQHDDMVMVDTVKPASPSPFAKLKQKLIGFNRDEPIAAAQKVSAGPLDVARIEDPAIAAQIETPAPTPITPSIDRLEPATLTASPSRQTITVHGQNLGPHTEVIVNWAGKQKILDKSRVSFVDPTKIQFEIYTGRKADKWRVTLRNPGAPDSGSSHFQVAALSQELRPQKLSAQKPAPGKKSASSTSSWLASQPENNLTLQLLGSHSLTPINNYIKRFKLANEAKIHTTQRNNKDWHILLYGSFKDVQSAQQTVQNLPASAKVNRPWIRRFGALKSEKAVTIADVKPTIRGKKTPKLQNIEAHEAWLWSQDPSKYTLQLLGTRNIDKLKRFISQHKLRGKVVYYQTRRDNQDWYALVYGVYPKNTDARQAVNQLPPRLKKLTPWVRNFSAIHAEMDKPAQ